MQAGPKAFGPSTGEVDGIKCLSLLHKLVLENTQPAAGLACGLLYHQISNTVVVVPGSIYMCQPFVDGLVQMGVTWCVKRSGWARLTRSACIALFAELGDSLYLPEPLRSTVSTTPSSCS